MRMWTSVAQVGRKICDTLGAYATVGYLCSARVHRDICRDHTARSFVRNFPWNFPWNFSRNYGLVPDFHSQLSPARLGPRRVSHYHRYAARRPCWLLRIQAGRNSRPGAPARDWCPFTQAFTHSPITNTSHITILTGLLPSVHGVTDFGVPLSPQHVTAAELLKKQGYQTAAFIGAVILDSNTLAPGIDRGFDFYDNFPAKTDTKERWDRVERRGMEVVEHAEAWFDKHRTGSHFVWVHLFDPHDPYEPPPPFSEKYKDHLYDGEIAYADSALTRWITFLKKTGVYDNAIIIITGDHGEGLGDHGEETHGLFL